MQLAPNNNIQVLINPTSELEALKHMALSNSLITNL